MAGPERREQLERERADEVDGERGGAARGDHERGDRERGVLAGLPAPAGRRGAPPRGDDRGALGDVLVNLIGNAVIAVGARGRVTISAALDGGARAIAVSDDGPGVPRELADRLFQPFVTGRGRDHAHPGTGLGLATARSIAERHGGSLRHEPVAGGGARFVVRLPIA
ncbi:MAG TPA: ATP-binding protein [Kofleriaceae bacterium]|nr:ATP-binding protein [Kofleriaceae bacterium]